MRASVSTLQQPAEGPVLALDSASPLVSVALGWATQVLAERSIELRQSSGKLIGVIDDLLQEAAIPLTELRGVVTLRGPGSFTGLRVGMATALGLSQALAIPAVAVPTLPALANWYQVARSAKGECLAAVDALRDHWFVQRFALGGSEPLSRSQLERWPSSRFDDLDRATVVGFGVERLSRSSSGLRLVEPQALATPTLHLPARPGFTWDRSTLLEPYYLSGPAVSPPRPRGRSEPAT